ncbi:hypothetical protein D3C75_1194530 [compost metagenome]
MLRVPGYPAAWLITLRGIQGGQRYHDEWLHLPGIAPVNILQKLIDVPATLRQLRDVRLGKYHAGIGR